MWAASLSARPACAGGWRRTPGPSRARSRSQLISVEYLRSHQDVSAAIMDSPSTSTMAPTPKGVIVSVRRRSCTIGSTVATFQRFAYVDRNVRLDRPHRICDEPPLTTLAEALEQCIILLRSPVIHQLGAGLARNLRTTIPIAQEPPHLFLGFFSLGSVGAFHQVQEARQQLFDRALYPVVLEVQPRCCVVRGESRK